MTLKPNLEPISKNSTPLSVIAHVSRIVTRVTDRVTGDRSDYSLLVAGACARALQHFGIESHVLYGHAAWIEVFEDQSVTWAISTASAPHFWVETQFHETVDLNASVAHKRKTKQSLPLKPQYSPPILWSQEVPSFFRFHAEGAAEIAPSEERDVQWWNRIQEEVDRFCKGRSISELESAELDFPNEPMICPGRKLLDDTEKSFQHFDRALSIAGLPAAPF